MAREYLDREKGIFPEDRFGIKKYISILALGNRHKNTPNSN